MAADTDIDDWLASEGILDAPSRVEARVVLAAAGLTRAGKQRIATHKLDRAREALWAGITPVCANPACLTAAGIPAKPIVRTGRDRCSVCAGSNTRRAGREMVEACAKSGLERILLLGGSGNAHAELRALTAGTPIEWRIIDGRNDRPTKRQALPDLAWAQLLVVWASTELPHRVSQVYTEDRPAGPPLITVARRGVEALCSAVVQFASGSARSNG
ncbi:MAG: hypothetical protein M9925_14185 [Chloroflexi bacterium]|nr:hypothetical protein [Chloroflexota bacterium]MCZ7576541.1 hypothetical protein [Dehalococcoidia bacterium]